MSDVHAGPSVTYMDYQTHPSWGVIKQRKSTEILPADHQKCVKGACLGMGLGFWGGENRL
jgi:GTPase involved in cell partitioning and DNA repair